MPEIKRDNVAGMLEAIRDGKTAPVYLLYGDEFFLKSVCQDIVSALVPLPQDQNLNCERLDGTIVNVYEIVEHLNTFPLFPGPKVIVVFGSRAFQSRKDSGELLNRSKDAFEKKNTKKAAGYFLQMLGLNDASLQDVADLGVKSFFQKTQTGAIVGGEEAMWQEILDYCLTEHLIIPSRDEEDHFLFDAIHRGLPAGTHLILATEIVDKRTKLYKTIKKNGAVVDCSIAQGSRSADKRKQKDILKAHFIQVVERAGKTWTSGTFKALFEKTGPHLRAFDSEVEKLIAFVGDSESISEDHVKMASEKTREDPIYELSNAVGERDVSKAISYLEGLLKANVFPLQILSVLSNQIRKLILSKDILRRLSLIKWAKEINYKVFQQAVLPELQKQQQDNVLGKVHPYVLFKTLLYSENYSMEELARGLESCLDADRRLKTSSQNPKLILENVMIQLCAGMVK